MGISVRNEANPSAVLTGAYGAGQGRRRNQVQDMALSAMERRRAQQRQILASAEAAARNVAAQKASQERAYAQQDRNRNFGEKSKRRAADLVTDRQQDQQRRAFDQQNKVRDSRVNEARDAAGKLADARVDRDKTTRQQKIDDRTYGEEKIKKEAEGALNIKIDNELDSFFELDRPEKPDPVQEEIDKKNRIHGAEQKRRLRDLEDQIARARANPDASDEQKKDTIGQLRAKHNKIKYNPTADKSAKTPEQIQQQYENTQNEAKERNKVRQELQKRASEQFTDGRGVFDDVKAAAWVKRNMDEIYPPAEAAGGVDMLGGGAGGADAGSGTVDIAGDDGLSAGVDAGLDIVPFTGDKESGAPLETTGLPAQEQDRQAPPPQDIQVPPPSDGAKVPPLGKVFAPDSHEGKVGMSEVPNAVAVLNNPEKYDNESRLQAIQLLVTQGKEGNKDAARAFLEYRKRIMGGR